MTLQIGSVLMNRYRILAVLGQGGFGAVYRAADMTLKRPCAVKENLDTSHEAQQQFEKEALILANLSHPHLPRVTDHFIIPGQGQYLVMDFIDGEDLQTMIEINGPLTTDQAINWITQIADALVYLHAQSPPVIHRDIKPANIRITPQGYAYLVDFGLVKIFDPHLRTTVGARAVTPGFSPPEQYGQGNTDNRTDIYALAATLYNLLTGLQPQESVQRVIDDQLIAAYNVNQQIPKDIGQVIEKAMDLRPSERFQNVTEFKKILHSPNLLVIRPTIKTRQPEILRQPWFWASILFGGFVLIIIIIVFAMSSDTPPPSDSHEIANEVGNEFTAFQNEAAPTYTPLPSYTPFPTYTLPPANETTKVSESPIELEVIPNPTNTPLPTNTSEPTHTPRPTVTPIPDDPLFRADQDMFCRDGPGSNYEEHTMVMADETLPVLAKWSNGWLLVGIDNPNTRTKCCWVGGEGSLNVSTNSIPTIDYLVDRITCQRK